MTSEYEFEKTKKDLIAHKEAKDYRSLLKRYYNINREDDDEKNFIFSLLSEDLSLIAPFLSDTDANYRKYTIEFFKDIPTRQGLLYLLDRLLKEDSPVLLEIIKDALCEQEEMIEEIQDDIYKIVKGIGGKRFELLAEVISFINAPIILRSIISKIKNCCPDGHEICAEDVVPENSFFVGHFFSRENIDDLRPCINEAVSSVFPDCKPYYADYDLGDELLCKICEKIQKTRFGIYDITIAPEKGYSNPNVMLEIGMSKAFGKKTIIIMKAGQEPPSDLRSKVNIPYSSHKQLKDELIRLLPGEVV